MHVITQSTYPGARFTRQALFTRLTSCSLQNGSWPCDVNHMMSLPVLQVGQMDRDHLFLPVQVITLQYDVSIVTLFLTGSPGAPALPAFPTRPLSP